jgi:hypothetical protein
LWFLRLNFARIFSSVIRLPHILSVEVRSAGYEDFRVIFSALLLPASWVQIFTSAFCSRYSDGPEYHNTQQVKSLFCGTGDSDDGECEHGHLS